MICNQLGIETASKEYLCWYIKQSKILIVIDVSSKVERIDSAVFNWSLDFFTDETCQPKFLVVT